MSNWLPNRTLVIAELSANHNQNFERAVASIYAIAASGADAVKVQTYTPESFCLNIDNQYFGKIKSGAWRGFSRWKLYQQGALPYEWHSKLQELAKQLGLLFFSSPFDEQSVDFLEELNVPFYKVASFEINHIPLIRKVAATQKPVILSTGVAELCDIQLALDTCHKVGNHQIALLKCTSQYPAKIEDANLATIKDMQNRFSIPIGLSDHTLGSLVPTVAVSMGARIVEKHFTLNRHDGGLDSEFSMEPDEFTEMVQQIRSVETSLGKVNYEVSDQDKGRRRSIFFCRDLTAGSQIEIDDIKILRNGRGIHPKYFDDLIGKKIRHNVKIGEPVTSDFIK